MTSDGSEIVGAKPPSCALTVKVLRARAGAWPPSEQSPATHQGPMRRLWSASAMDRASVSRPNTARQNLMRSRPFEQDAAAL
jgi:hypothetical protein